VIDKGISLLLREIATVVVVGSVVMVQRNMIFHEVAVVEQMSLIVKKTMPTPEMVSCSC
jgi:hypothetical protein